MDQGRESGKTLAEFFAIGKEMPSCVTRSDCASGNKPSSVPLDGVAPIQPDYGTVNKAAIMFTKVSFAYGHSRKFVLHECSLAVKRGETVCLIGRNGAGKSTFINLVLGILKPSEGEVTVGFNRPAIVPQRVNVFTGSIFENIRLYDQSITEEMVARTADECGLSPWLVTLRNGLRTKISPETVSGGELQRLAIARAIIRCPDLLIVDEITNNLDIVEKRRIRKILKKLKGRHTILTVTHDIDMTGDADRCFAFTGETIHELFSEDGENILEAATREINE